MSQHWDPDFASRSPMFEPVRHVAARLPQSRWPALEDLQQLAAARAAPIRTGSGAPLVFVAQGARARQVEERYEARIFLAGEVQVRAANWHDLFNALAWLTFPQSKAALNARHYHALLAQQASSARNRGPVQDALTLFDEGGVIVASVEPHLHGRIRACEWKTLFWHERGEVERSMRFMLFGHALYEKALAPFTGVTGRSMLVQVGVEFLTLALSAQIEQIDRAVAARLLDAETVHATQDFPPLPILGVPGWCADNEREPYYDDTAYFRPRRRA